MDIDVLAGRVQTLKENGYKILNDGAFRRSLRIFDIADIEINDPAGAKQTETTQRFRVGLVTSAGHWLPTKVEFSRRRCDQRPRLVGGDLVLVSHVVAASYPVCGMMSSLPSVMQALA